MTFREALKEGTSLLQQAGVPDAALDASFLLEYICGISRHQFFMRQNEPMDAASYTAYREALWQRAQRIPLQHIVGTTEFMGLPFLVNSDVLIPRQETELLVEQILPVATGKNVLDLCTGSGCIGISIAKLCPGTHVTAADISKKALKTAQKNAKANEVDVKFVLSDLFEKIEGEFDLIISNPPYIEKSEIAALMPEVKKYEPMMALDGGEDGLFFYQNIAKQAPKYLRRDGMLAFEIGYNQGKAVEQLMKDAGFGDVQIRQDYAGLDRTVSGILQKND